MTNYRYYNIELQPEIFAELLLILFEGKLFGREECIDMVKTYHISHGGICSRETYIDTFKHATIILRRKGYPITNVAYGKWRIDENCGRFISYRDELAKASRSVNQELQEDERKEIGFGGETVYVYYYPVYKRYALAKGNDCWHCKVGMTTKKLWDRIYSQAGTCFPEKPFVALVIKCDEAHKVEQTLHSILRSKGKWVETAPGKEWFITSPAEIESIYKSNILE